MNFERWGETLLGAAVAVVAVDFFAFAAAQTGQRTADGGYELSARFQRVDGVNVGSDVRVSGVKVGVVRAVSLDPETYMARLTFDIDPNVHILDESTAHEPEARTRRNDLSSDIADGATQLCRTPDARYRHDAGQDRGGARLLRR